MHVCFIRLNPIHKVKSISYTVQINTLILNYL